MLGLFYVHVGPVRRQRAAVTASSSPAFHGTRGDTSYYFFGTEAAVVCSAAHSRGARVADRRVRTVRPVIVELGYDRSIPPWEPTWHGLSRRSIR